MCKNKKKFTKVLQGSLETEHILLLQCFRKTVKNISSTSHKQKKNQNKTNDYIWNMKKRPLVCPKLKQDN